MPLIWGGWTDNHLSLHCKQFIHRSLILQIIINKALQLLFIISEIIPAVLPCINFIIDHFRVASQRLLIRIHSFEKTLLDLHISGDTIHF